MIKTKNQTQNFGPWIKDEDDIQNWSCCYLFINAAQMFCRENQEKVLGWVDWDWGHWLGRRKAKYFPKH